jgi:hypothetical protein
LRDKTQYNCDDESRMPMSKRKQATQAPAATGDNPFAPREARSVVFTFRMTPGEDAALAELAGKGGDKSEVIRKGIALLFEQQRQQGGRR